MSLPTPIAKQIFYIHNRGYEFSSSLLIKTNVLAVRVHDSSAGGGIYEGDIGIVRKEEHMNYPEIYSKAKVLNKEKTVDWLFGNN